MRYLSCFLILFGFTFSHHSFADTEISRVLINCTLNVSGSNGRNHVINNLNNDVYLGHTDDPNELQNVFAIAESEPDLNSIAKSAIYGRAFRIDGNTSGVTIGFYRAQIRFPNSLSEGVIQHEALSSWQFTPQFVFEYELDHRTGLLTPVERMEYTTYGDFEYLVIEVGFRQTNNTEMQLGVRESIRFTGLNYLDDVNLSCSGYPQL